MKLSSLAQGIRTSEIITLAAEINEKIHRGEEIYNLTIGDFNPTIFPIPLELKEEIIAAYEAGHTNYPGAPGLPVLRNAVLQYLADKDNLSYQEDEILIGSGGRPLIYSAYRAIVDPGDRVIFPVPSWNNDHYSYLTRAEPLLIETGAENYFMPTAKALAPHIKGASLLALCSPLNPTGTVLSKTDLEDICDLVLAENRSRKAGEKPLYILFDQIYWQLTFGETRHYNAVNLRPEIHDYSVFVDGMSKTFAATGVRVGWAFGPPAMIAKMRSIVSHMGAWAPKAEQVASGNFLNRREAVNNYLQHFRTAIRNRLEGFYKGFSNLERKGYHVDAIEPQAAIYLTVKLDLRGAKTPAGKRLGTNNDVHRYILEEAKIGLVPFIYFGASEDSPWYRLSVGTCRLEEVEVIMARMEESLRKLS